MGENIEDTEETLLDHLITSWNDGDTNLYMAAVISYNNAVRGVASMSCCFCGGPGHKSKGCRVRVCLS